MGKLNIKIHGARNLYNQEWFGTRHAYVVIELESRQYRTRTTDSNRNPKWEEEFAIYIANVDNTMIRLSIMGEQDEEEMMGWVSVYAQDLYNGVSERKSITLEDCERGEGIAELEVTLQALDFGKPPACACEPPKSVTPPARLTPVVTKRVPELNTAAPQSPVLPDWSPRSQSPGPEAEGHYNYIEGFNGRVYAGSRVKTQWAIAEGGDGQWYRGTAYHIFPAEGTATIKFDDKDFVRLEGPVIWLENPNEGNPPVSATGKAGPVIAADKERAYRLVPYDQFHLAWLQENGKRGLALDPQQDALVRQLQNEVRDMQKDVSLAMTSEADLRFEFSKYDVNGDGWLNTTEFLEVCKVYNPLHEQNYSQIERLAMQYNSLGDGKLSFDEFSVIMLQLAAM
jgi:hypothetical protein